MELCVEVAGKHNYEMHFNLRSFVEKLQTLDLKHWKVKLSKGKEILNELSHESCGIRKKEENILYKNYVTTLWKLKENEQ